ncbi:MAG: hypothetical protein EOP48_33870 [Sphingobacteriales bacterium]|nr:MAG: hypothetical protein EOP48_33870 [Sphingobacteriales bacterium]
MKFAYTVILPCLLLHLTVIANGQNRSSVIDLTGEWRSNEYSITISENFIQITKSPNGHSVDKMYYYSNSNTHNIVIGKELWTHAVLTFEDISNPHMPPPKPTVTGRLELTDYPPAIPVIKVIYTYRVFKVEVMDNQEIRLLWSNDYNYSSEQLRPHPFESDGFSAQVDLKRK